MKRLLTEKDVLMRKMHSAEYTMTPCLCSFFATTNAPIPLSSAGAFQTPQNSGCAQPEGTSQGHQSSSQAQRCQQRRTGYYLKLHENASQ